MARAGGSVFYLRLLVLLGWRLEDPGRVLGVHQLKPRHIFNESYLPFRLQKARGGVLRTQARSNLSYCNFSIIVKKENAKWMA